MKMLISEKKRGQNRINNRSWGGQEWVESLFRTVKRNGVWHKLIKYQTYVKFLTQCGADVKE